MLVLAVSAPLVNVVTLDGKTRQGTLAELTAEHIAVSAKGKTVRLPVRELMEVSFPPAQTPPKTAPAPYAVTLTDGTQILCTQIVLKGNTAEIQSPAFGTLKLPRAALAHIRLAPAEAALSGKWQELCQRKLRKDYVVVNRKTTLDFLSVVVGEISPEKVSFSFAGMQSSLPRKPPLYGVIFARTAAENKPVFCRVELADGNAVQVSALSWREGKLQGTLPTGTEIGIPLDRLRRLDFSLGKVKYLSDMEPREVEFTPWIDDKWYRQLFRYRRDKTHRNRKLQLGKTVYERGLWIHSRTRLVYRLNGEYRRFRAMMGIDYDVAERGLGHVNVVIRADGKTLLERSVRGTDPPIPLDLDVSGARNLEIFVDYGPRDDPTADHLDLCNARLIK